MSLWTVQQHEWLRALGHPVLLLAGDPALTATPTAPTDAGTSAAVADAPSAADSGHNTNRDSRPPVAGRSSPATDRTGPATARRAPPANPMVTPQSHASDQPQTAAPRADAAAKKAALEAARGARRATRPPSAPLPADDPLVQAIARASGMDAGAFEAAAQTWQIDLAQLRAKPSAKRALWQRMRKPRRTRDR